MSQGVDREDVLGWPLKCPTVSVTFAVTWQELESSRVVDEFDRRHIEMSCPHCPALIRFKRCIVNGARYSEHIGSA